LLKIRFMVPILGPGLWKGLISYGIWALEYYLTLILGVFFGKKMNRVIIFLPVKIYGSDKHFKGLFTLDHLFTL